MTMRCCPVSLVITGDTGITDAQAIREINTLLAWATELARQHREQGHELPTCNEYRLQPLEVAQFVVAGAVPQVKTPGWEPPGGITRPTRPTVHRQGDVTRRRKKA